MTQSGVYTNRTGHHPTKNESEDFIMNNNIINNNQELSMDDLNNVNGGCPFLVGAILYSVGVIAGSYYCGRKNSKKKK